jgi:hypothetical protein
VYVFPLASCERQVDVRGTANTSVLFTLSPYVKVHQVLSYGRSGRCGNGVCEIGERCEDVLCTNPTACLLDCVFEVRHVGKVDPSCGYVRTRLQWCSLCVSLREISALSSTPARTHGYAHNFSHICRHTHAHIHTHTAKGILW